MGQFIRIGNITDFPEGHMKHVMVKAKELLIANVSGNVYAMSSICTHEECELTDGFLQGEVVTCPCHLSQFNVKTGAVVQNPATGTVIESEPTFEVKVEGGEVFVEV